MTGSPQTQKQKTRDLIMSAVHHRTAEGAVGPTVEEVLELIRDYRGEGVLMTDKAVAGVVSRLIRTGSLVSRDDHLELPTVVL